MDRTSIMCEEVNGFVTIRIEGNLRISTLYYLTLLAECYSERSNGAIILDVSGELVVADEVRRLRKKALDFSGGGMTIVIMGRRENSEKLREVLSKHLVS